MYKTSILVFRDRDRYVNGEFRFRKVRSCVCVRVLRGRAWLTMPAKGDMGTALLTASSISERYVHHALRGRGV